ncbi:carboxypeptidase-like regulatory domain-containing protein [Aquimarina brevivitae]|uniref:Carboxypeptidase-like protein n=1 Tax=Aquimarina brevivitae TaxID=323412 RepID=A0A4Q7NYZ8_9FLAO|nr:carboxypeptidase-like regulatory domain-containing protein [Aquimarina brevivitae]RZS92534.1 carboxypeptidase-like protein [Aquimarina brevivitae]
MNKKRKIYNWLLLLWLSITANSFLFAFQEADIKQDFKEYKGTVVDSDNNDPLTAATVSLDDSNISTVTNSDGVFLLKIPKNIASGYIRISYLGYQDKAVPLANFTKDDFEIKVDKTITELSEVNINPKDPEALIRAVMDKKGENYFDQNTIMTAFYREAIRKRRTYVSLSEAVVDIYKRPYVSGKNDLIKLFKARKSADYKRLDTVAVKLQGGPSSTLYIDLMKNPDNVFTQNMLEYYDFSFAPTTKLDDKFIYVLKFKQKPNVIDPLYEGKLYIDAESLALKRAIFKLNTENEEEVSEMFVRRKPSNADVYITEANYDINYREHKGRWYYNYGRIGLEVKIDWDKRLFNSKYQLDVEMAITDWRTNENETLKARDRLKSSVVLADEAEGFSDPEFWGEYNVIEPEKSIESAIKKIKRQLRRMN